MRRTRCFALLAAVMLFLACMACQEEDWTRATYKTLASAGITYDAVMRASADAYKAGQLADATRANIEAYGEKFYGAYHLARVALEEYVKTKDVTVKERVATLLVDVVADLSELRTYTNAALGTSF